MLTVVRKQSTRLPGRNISRRAMRNGRMFYDNSLAAFDPQIWAQTSLAILTENMVMAQLVHRDFEPILASYGDTVNTRKPSEFKAKRKTPADSVTVQDASAVNVPVVMNQTWHVSYLIKDGEESVSMTSIIDEFLRPAAIAEARAIDLTLIGEWVNFLPNAIGGFGTGTADNIKQSVLNVRRLMNANKAWVNDRNLLLNVNTETLLLEVEQFTDANRVGDDGTALREASLGRKLGFDMILDQNMPSTLTPTTGSGANQIAFGAINHSGGYNPGTNTFTISGITGIIATGTWVMIDGDDTPLRVSAHSETTGNTTSITTTQKLQSAVANSAAVRVINPGVVSGNYNVDSRGVGYAKEITISATGYPPQVGQLVTLGDDNYMIIDVNGSVGITLDRPLVNPASNGDPVWFGPTGDVNLAFHPNAIALVSRPLAPPRPGTGALSSVINWDSLSIRVTITYQGTLQGHLVTLDMLMGKKQLELNLGVPLLT